MRRAPPHYEKNCDENKSMHLSDTQPTLQFIPLMGGIPQRHGNSYTVPAHMVYFRPCDSNFPHAEHSSTFWQHGNLKGQTHMWAVFSTILSTSVFFFRQSFHLSFGTATSDLSYWHGCIGMAGLAPPHPTQGYRAL